MFAVSVSFLMMALLLMGSAVAAQYTALWGKLRTKTQQADLILLAEGLEMFYTEKNAFPASLSAFVSSPGYEYLRSAISRGVDYSVSPTISDGIWSFNRAVVYLYDGTKGLTPTTYLASNTCGSGDFSSAVSWCGLYTSLYFKRESRDKLLEQITTQRLALNRLSMKFAAYYSANQQYPTKDASNASLAANSITSMAALAGYGGTAANCSGQFQYQGIPIDCSDMFDRWGGAVGLQFVDSQHIIFVSEPPIFDNTGAKVLIAVDRA